jgi:hypothetical protein
MEEFINKQLQPFEIYVKFVRGDLYQFYIDEYPIDEYLHVGAEATLRGVSSPLHQISELIWVDGRHRMRIGEHYIYEDCFEDGMVYDINYQYSIGNDEYTLHITLESGKALTSLYKNDKPHNPFGPNTYGYCLHGQKISEEEWTASTRPRAAISLIKLLPSPIAREIIPHYVCDLT